MNTRTIVVLAWLLVATTATGQDAVKKGTDPPTRAVAVFHNGDILNVTIIQDKLEVVTEYGKLDIPLAKVYRIDFGLHYPPNLEKSIRDAIERLGNETYKEREEASKFLVQAGHFAYPMIVIEKTAKEPLDAERTQRTKSILKKIGGQVSQKLLKMETDDVVHTASFMIKGRVKGTAFRAQSDQLGEVTLKFSDLLTLQNAASKERKVKVDALKYGSDPNQWLETGVIVRPNTQLTITAEGQVDLWPQTPGQYMVTPKGYTTAGKGNFMAGAFIGRIGLTGKAFLIGERCECTPSEEGMIFLQIVPSPWNNSSSGSYTARIETNYKIP